MIELQQKMEAKSRYQPSKTVEALFTTAVVKIKADAEKAIAERKSVSETEVVSTEAAEAKAEESIIEQKAEPEVETEATLETNEKETESVEKTDASETESETELVPQKETTEALENEDEQKTETAKDEAEDIAKDETKDVAKDETKDGVENKAEDVDGTSEAVAEEKVEATDESHKSDTDEVSQNVQQVADSQKNQPREQLLAGSDLCAKDVMLKEVVWASSEDSVQQAITKIQQRNSEYLMIGRDEVLEGIISNTDIMGALSPYLRPAFAKWRRELDDATLKIRLKWIMSKPVRTIKSEASLVEIVENMCRFSQRAFPVVDEQDKVQGLVTVFDIFSALGNPTDISMTDRVPKAHLFEQFDLGIDKKEQDAK